MLERSRRGAELMAFLKSFEGAVASFDADETRWSLWLPEVAAIDRPVAPAAQVYFPVILRHEDQAYAIRFFYDCGTGKMKYYTGAVPRELSASPHFENAVSELFRHSLPVEPVRQRALRHLEREADSDSKPAVVEFGKMRPGAVERDSLAEPAEQSAGLPTRSSSRQESPVRQSPGRRGEKGDHPDVSSISGSGVLLRLVPRAPRTERIPSAPATPPPQATRSDTADRSSLAVPDTRRLSPVLPETMKVDRKVRIEICEHTKRLIMAAILAVAFLGFLGISAMVFLQIKQDPGVMHHRLQLEAMRLQQQGGN